MEEPLELFLREVLFFSDFYVPFEFIISKNVKMQTRYSHAKLQTISDDSMANYDLDAILREVNDIDKNVIRTEEAERALDNKGMSRSHWNRASKQEQSFLDGLSVVRDKDGNQKWASLLVEVANPNKTSSRVGSERSEMVPKAFVVLAGVKTQKKVELANAMLCDWQLDLKMKKLPKGKKECPFYAPVTQNMNLRTFYAHMRKNHGWNYYESDFKSWKGCLDGVLSERYAQRLKAFGDEGFGARNPNCAMTEEESFKVDLAKFDETDLRQLQIKLMVGFGALMGFRGNKEHTNLMFSQIGHGYFPPNHPVYPGLEWWGLTSFLMDKTSKLTSSNSYRRENEEAIARFGSALGGVVTARPSIHANHGKT